MRRGAGALILLMMSVIAPARGDTLLMQWLTPAGSGDFAFALAGLEDVDGDGLAEVVISAPSGSAGGRVHVFNASTGGQLYSVQLPVPQANAFFGGSVAGVHDLNGDGVMDFIVGAYMEDVGGLQNIGRAYVFSGSNGVLIHMLNSPATTGGGQFGFSVDGVPDTDDDRVPDVVVGARNLGPPSTAGRAFLFSGASGALLQSYQSLAPQEAGHFGQSVSGIEDLDGDGRGDVIVGASGEEPASVTVFSGATGRVIHALASTVVGDLDYFGIRVDAVRDVNGDGTDDIVVGAFGHGPGGIAHLFDGAVGQYLGPLVSPHLEMGGFFGWYVSGVSDVDGDGRGDVLVSAHLEDPCSTPTSGGRAYLFSGATRELLAELRSPHQAAQGGFGSPCIGIPDADGDARGDVILAARGQIPRRVYVFALEVEPQVFADLDEDARVEAADLQMLLDSWGVCAGCLPDLDCNGQVNGLDLGILLANWSF